MRGGDGGRGPGAARRQGQAVRSKEEVVESGHWPPPPPPQPPPPPLLLLGAGVVGEVVGQLDVSCSLGQMPARSKLGRHRDTHARPGTGTSTGSTASVTRVDALLLLLPLVVVVVVLVEGWQGRGWSSHRLCALRCVGDNWHSILSDC